MTGERTSWTRDDPVTSSFAHPRGLRGRLAALIMAATSGLNVTEVAALVPLRAGQQVLEVGYGPGTLLAALHNRPEHPRLVGVDPAPEMLRIAARRVPDADLRLGQASATGLDTASIDHVVSVNTVAIWPDLEVGLDELARVLRPGGSLLLGWHNAAARSPVARRLALPYAALDRIEIGIRARYSTVERVVLSNLLMFYARR